MNATDVNPQPMNGTDAALWDIERNPLLRTTVVSVLMLDRTIDRDALLATLAAASRNIVRLRQRVRPAPLGVGVPSWVIADDFDVSDHVRFIEPTPGARRRRGAAAHALPDEVIAAVTEFAEQPFDRERPLWECTYLSPLPGQRSALIIKSHHSLADGVGGVGLLDVLLADSRTPRIPKDIRADDADREEHKPFVVVGGHSPLSVGSDLLSRMLHPVGTAKSLVNGGVSTARLLSPGGEACSPLFGERSTARRPAVGEIDLQRMRDAAHRHNCTMNHLLIAGVIGGVAEHHRASAESSDDPGLAELADLRVTMPVSIRRRGAAVAGNEWAPARLRVPADIDDPVERMRAIRDLTVAARREPAIGITKQIAGAVQLLPSALTSGIVESMMSGVDLTITNVPGLTEERYLAGARVERLYGFAPTGGAAISVALVSHVDTACVGMLCDTAAVSDPLGLTTRVLSGLESALEAAEATPPSRSEPTPSSPRPASSEPQRLTALDASFLQLETPETPMHLGGVFILEGAKLRDADGWLSTADIRTHVAERLGHAPHYLRRLVDVPFGQGRPLWVPDPDFDIEHHVRVTSIDAPGSTAELLHLCAELNAERLDRSRPLWELWVIDGLANGDVGLLTKVHHSLVDGIGSVELVATLFDLEEHPDDTGPAPLPDAPPLPTPTELLAKALSEQLLDPISTVGHALSAVAKSPSNLLGLAKGVAANIADLGQPGAIAPSSPINQRVGRRRTVASTHLAFSDIDRIRTELGGTANDIALAALTGGLRAWLTDAELQTPDLHALCPVSVRQDGAEASGGNSVGAMIITLPIGDPDPVRRLATIRDRTQHAKQRHRGETVAAALDTFDHLPVVNSALLRSMVAHQPFANLIITNVPGPRSPLWFHGAPTRSIVPLVPLGPNMTLGIALLSYVDDLCIGFHTDRAHVEGVDELVRAVEQDFVQLHDAARERRQHDNGTSGC